MWALSSVHAALPGYPRRQLARLPHISLHLYDVGLYLSATVTYSDRFGSGKTAAAVSAYRVEARTAAHASPSFASQDYDEDTPYMEVRQVP